MDGLACRLVSVGNRTYRVQGGVLATENGQAEEGPGDRVTRLDWEDGATADDPRISRQDATTWVTRISADSEVGVGGWRRL